MTSSAVSSLLWFAAIVALIPLSLWLLKRTPIAGAAGAAGLRSIAALPLSTNQRIVTVEVGHGDERRWLVLGVTPTSITTLHTMAPHDAPAAPTAPSPAHPSFAGWLDRYKSASTKPRSDAK